MVQLLSVFWTEMSTNGRISYADAIFQCLGSVEVEETRKAKSHYIRDVDEKLLRDTWWKCKCTMDERLVFENSHEPAAKVILRTLYNVAVINPSSHVRP